MGAKAAYASVHMGSLTQGAGPRQGCCGVVFHAMHTRIVHLEAGTCEEQWYAQFVVEWGWAWNAQQHSREVTAPDGAVTGSCMVLCAMRASRHSAGGWSGLGGVAARFAAHCQHLQEALAGAGNMGTSVIQLVCCLLDAYGKLELLQGLQALWLGAMVVKDSRYGQKGSRWRAHGFV